MQVHTIDQRHASHDAIQRFIIHETESLTFLVLVIDNRGATIEDGRTHIIGDILSVDMTTRHSTDSNGCGKWHDGYSCFVILVVDAILS